MLNCKWLIVNFRKTIFLLFVFSTIHSQSLYELFKNDLPENHLNFFPLEFIEKSFQQDVKISPEMIYWRMKYFKQAMKDSSTVSDREEVKFAKDYILSRYEDKSLWIKKQLELTKQNYRNSDLYSAITNALEFMLPAYEFYKDFEYKEEQAPNNELYYYLLKFHTRDKGKIYYESIDYKIEWENYYSSFIKKLESRYKNLSLEDSEQDENFLSDIFEYWHIIHKMEKTFPYPEMIKSYYIKYYSESKTGSYNFSIMAGYKINFIDYEYNSKFMLPVYNVEHIFPVKNSKTGFEFQLTYRILLGTSFPLSSLNIAILGTFGELKNKAIEPISFIRKINIIDDENFTVEQVLIEKLNFTSHKYFSLYLKLSTLAFFIARDFFIDVGFIGGLNIINSSFDASYFYQRIKRTYDGTEHITVEEMRQEPSYKTSSEIYNFYFSPQIDFNYNFYPIGLQLSLGYDFASLKLGYLFNL